MLSSGPPLKAKASELRSPLPEDTSPSSPGSPYREEATLRVQKVHYVRLRRLRNLGPCPSEVVPPPEVTETPIATVVRALGVDCAVFYYASRTSNSYTKG